MAMLSCGISCRLILGIVAAGAMLGADLSPAQYNIPLWEEGKVPLARGNGPLDKPFLTVVQPPEGKRNRASVVVAPGGGNIMLMYGTEGFEIAERYNEWGVTAFVLTYRLTPYGQDARTADGNRAVRMVRSLAQKMDLDPTKVGFIGFSAGASMIRPMVAAATPGDPNAADPVERFNSKPDYVVPVYGPGGSGRGRRGRAAAPQPDESLKGFPPTFIMAAQNDRMTSVPSALLFAELTQAGVTAEIHVYQQGRHGFGVAAYNKNLSDWMGRLKHFLEVDGFLPAGDAQ